MNDDVRVLLARLERLLENVHQYVGARYVPNFIDEPWNDTRGYEALDVVDNGTGTSYIAKKPVPPGTPLSNREYWFVYGSTSGAIINLQNQIDAIVDELETTTAKVFDASTLAMFKDKTVCIVGDSISDESTQQPNWVDVFTDIVEGAGGSVHNASVAGSSISGWGNDPTSIPTGYDIYIVALGINDFQGQFSQATLLSAITAITNRIDLTNPNRRAFYISPLKAFISTFNNMYTPQSAYRHFFETVFAKYGYQIISGCTFPNLSVATYGSYLDGAQIHPTPAYAPIYAEHVVKCMLAGSSELSPFYGYVKAAELNPDMVYTQGNASIVWNGENSYKFSINLFGVECTALQWMPLFKISNNAGGGLISNEINETTTTSYTGNIYQWRINNGYLEVATSTTGTFNFVVTLTGAYTIDPSIA